MSRNSQYTFKSVTTDDGNLWTHSEYSYENNIWVWGHTTTIKYIGDLSHLLWDDMLFANGHHVRTERMYNGDNYTSIWYYLKNGIKEYHEMTESSTKDNYTKRIKYKYNDNGWGVYRIEEVKYK